ncbi:MAG: hypothetical protein NZ455_15380 [Bacteroidia bacterium]|nr:hypothetical protein [Bacteroidia bacterium]
MPVRAVRSVSEVPKRSVVRNAPTLAQQGARQKLKLSFELSVKWLGKPALAD